MLLCSNALFVVLVERRSTSPQNAAPVLGRTRLSAVTSTVINFAPHLGQFVTSAPATGRRTGVQDQGGHRRTGDLRLSAGPRRSQAAGAGCSPLGSECCVAAGDSGCEAYTAIAWGVGLSHERSDIAGAEGFHSLEGNMCGTVRRGADALPGSKATSRAKGSHRNLGDLGSGHRCRVGAEYDGPHREGEEP